VFDADALDALEHQTRQATAEVCGSLKQLASAIDDGVEGVINDDWDDQSLLHNLEAVSNKCVAG
jgi:hypothetical protein